MPPQHAESEHDVNFATINIERPAADTAVIAIDGQLDVYSAPDVRRAFIDAINKGRYRQVINLTAVTLLDSTGLGVIVGQRKRLLQHGGDLVLVVTSDRIGKVLRVTGMHKVIDQYTTVSDALAALRATGADADTTALIPAEQPEHTIRRAIDKLDTTSHTGPWTRPVLAALGDLLQSAAEDHPTEIEYPECPNCGEGCGGHRPGWFHGDCDEPVTACQCLGSRALSLACAVLGEHDPTAAFTTGRVGTMALERTR
jgi:anti-sigma B factor antagonist